MKVTINMRPEIAGLLQRVTDAGLGGYELSDTAQEAIISGVEQWSESPLYRHVFKEWRKNQEAA